MFEIVFLGTSASAPSVQRGLPAQVIKHDEYRFLVDCGEGTQRQILKSGIGFKNLSRILITHGHLDHILGLGGLVSTLARWEAIEGIEIYGGQSALERIHDLLFGVVLRGAKTNLHIQLHTIQPGPFFFGKDFKVSAFPVNHRGGDSLGYLFEEEGRRPFLPEKAEELAIPPGPWRRELVEGKSVRLPDGRTIQPDEVLGEFKPGARLVYVGDVGKLDTLVEVCRDADALIIEATYLKEEADMARQFSHITARQAAELAREAGVGELILTHLSRRYNDKDVLHEAQSVFEHVSVARDFDVSTIKKV